MKNRFSSAFLLLFCLSSFESLAQIDSIVITGFTIPTCGCDGLIDITVTGGISQPPASSYAYLWSNGSSTQDQFNLCPGTYCVTVVSNQNMTATACFTVPYLPFTPLEIVSSNTAPCNSDSTSISNDCEKVCPGTTVVYSSFAQNPNGTSSNLFWQVTGASSWTYNSSNSPNFSSITVTWGTSGTGVVSVFADGVQGCSGEAVLCVTVVDEPKAKFSSSPAAAIAGGPLQVCLGQTVNFQNLSTGDADFYEWFFSDDLSSTSVENPQHSYLIPGTHTVTLVARSSCLCADTTQMTVEVLDAQAPGLECVSTVCPGETVTYTATNACPPFDWAVSGNGTILNGGTPTSDTISVQWTDGPVGTITLGAQPCAGAACPLGGQIAIPVITNDAQIIGQDRVCPGATEVYTIEPFGGTSFVWTLPTGGQIVAGQGTNRVTVEWNTFPNPAPAADHTLYVQYENCYLGCGGADFIHVRILSSFHIEGPLEACENSSGNFSSKLNTNNQPILCNWMLSAPDGSTAWTSPAPTAIPSVPFLNGAGVYRLTATPNDASITCSDESDWAIHVRALPSEPTGIAGEINICPGTTYTYEATGLPAGANVRWALKNGAGAAQTLSGNPLNVTWGNTGPYWLTAAQISADGLSCLSDTVGLVATPIPAPTISGTPVVCEDSKGNYSILNLQNVDIQWTISPPTAGSVADGQGTNAVEIFWNQPGGHVVNVSVCSQSSLLPVTVLANPDPVPLHPTGLCPGQTAMVQTASGYANYTWKDESGATISSSATPTLGAGIYSIEVVDANGCVGAEEFEIQSWDAPNVSLTTSDPTGFCNNSYTVSLTALTNTNANYTYQWFRDGNPVAGASSPTLFSNQYGLYTVQATNSYGCTATDGPILLFEYCDPNGSGNCSLCNGGAPYCAAGSIQAVPDPTPRCDSFVMVLNDYSGLYVPGSAVWTTGISGGAVIGTVTGDNPSFIYPNAGKYVVVVRVQLSDGTICDALDSVDVEAVARFDELPGCPGDMTSFENTTELLPESSIVNYAWDFDDPGSGANNISNAADPTHSFALAGSYMINLTVTTASGCTSSASRLVAIPDFDPPVFADPASKCAGNALEFIAAPNPDIIELVWDFDDPPSGAANDATGNTVYHSYSAGTYLVTATSKNVYGCVATFDRSVTVLPSTLAGNISPANPGPICEGKTITLTAPTGAVSYLWSDASAATTQALTVGQERSYSVTMTDANGCTYSPPAVNVEINPAPDALVKALLFNDLNQVIGLSYPSVATCFGEDLALQAFSNGAASYSWSGGNGNDQVVYFTDDRNTLLPVGTHLYSVTVTALTTGCTAVSDPFLVTVNPVPTGFFISSPTYCAGDPNVITYNGPSPANWQFFWNTGASGTSLTTEEAGSYYIRVINEFGCEAKSDPLVILPGPQVSSIPAGCHTRCKPDTLCIPNLPNIASWQWFLDGNPIPGATSANFIAQQSGTYWAELTDIFGCSAASDPLSLQLFDGYGNILGNIWSDVNDNGIIDAADTLLAGVTVVVYQNGVLYDAATSDAEGDFALTNILSTNYSFSVDPFSLPAGWSIVIGQDQTTLSGCDVEGQVDFLLHFGCQAFGTLELAACPGGFATYNGTNISVGGTATFNLTSPTGCDSTLVVSVAALPTSSNAINLQACPGETANYAGLDLPIGAVQDFTFTNWLGCDSIVTATVTEASHFVLFLDAVACQGSFFEYQGQQIPAGSEAIITQVNAEGCLDTIIVAVFALPPATSNLNLQACPGGTVNYAGVDLAVGAVQDFTLSDEQGCDSVVTVTVTALPTSSSSLTLRTCPGSSATYNGMNIAAGSTQDIVLANAAGCDSTVTVTVMDDLPMSSSGISVGVCPGETYTYMGTTLNAGDIQDFILTNFVGCDSLVTVSVFEKNISSDILQVTVCPGEDYVFMGETIEVGDSREFHLLNSEGCDSTLTIFVAAFPETVFNLHVEASCSNSPTGILELSGVSGGPAPYQFSLNNIDFQTDTRFEGLQAGDFSVWAKDANGCVFQRDASIPAIPSLAVQLANGILPCDSAGVRLEAVVLGGDTSSLQYNWWNGAREISSVATEAGAVWVEVSDECETVRQEAMVEWAELASDMSIVYVPNVFKPAANDAENARFRPFFANGIALLGFHFEVFDRWGNKLFETSSTEDGWDGVFRAQHFNPGVQVWQLWADIAICGRVMHVERKGDVTVVR